MSYPYLEPIGSFKDGLRLVARDEDLVEMCSWVLRFKLIEFYAKKRDRESIIHMFKSQSYVKKSEVKSLVVIEEIEEPIVEHVVRRNRRGKKIVKPLFT